MKLNQHAYFVWIATLNTLLGLSHLPLAEAAPLDEKDKKIQILEQRLLLLEKRLDAQAVSISPPKQSIEELDQKIKILERHNEIAQEEAEEKTKTSPKFDVSPKFT